AATLERIELNLEWAVCLVQMFELEPALHAEFEACVPDLSAALTALVEGKEPQSLATASPAARQRVSKAARLASKQLDVLRRAAQSMFQ
ncbi:unnamed protein product, partial [Polarella glacialis]